MAKWGQILRQDANGIMESKIADKLSCWLSGGNTDLDLRPGEVGSCVRKFSYKSASSFP